MKYTLLITALLCIALGVLCILPAHFLSVADPTIPSQTIPTAPPTEPPTEPPTAPPTEPPTETPTEPPVTKEHTVTLGATGDILLHDNVILSGANGDGTYDYNYIFEHLASYIGKLDYMVGNMEGTLAGAENGYPYKGYPQFNAPDAIAEAAKNAGFDMLLTANNHSYDTRSLGFHRTQQVISQLGLDHIGTRPNAQALNYLVKDIGGIRFGMTCYTYNTAMSDNGSVSLNGIPLSISDSSLINSFNYGKLDAFYGKLSEEIQAMRTAGAEMIVLYIHWGNEYETTPNATQKAMAQALCDLGVDVIIGGHAHVMQPMEILTSTVDPSKSTLCLYSLGNAVSNIVKSNVHPAECEDGMIFTVRFAKYSDGSVIVEGAEVIPYYVNRRPNGDRSKYAYPIIPLAIPREQWKDAFGLTDEWFGSCVASFSRTEAILQGCLDASNAFLKQQQTQLETALGISAQ